MNAKKYLQDVRLCDTHIRTKLAEIDNLQDMLLKITYTLQEDPVCGSKSHDKVGDAIARIIDLKTALADEVQKYADQKEAARTTIDKLSDPDQLEVIHMRYMQFKTFEQIACDLHMSYRNVCYIHGKALQAVQKEIVKSE